MATIVLRDATVWQHQLVRWHRTTDQLTRLNRSDDRTIPFVVLVTNKGKLLFDVFCLPRTVRASVLYKAMLDSQVFQNLAWKFITQHPKPGDTLCSRSRHSPSLLELKIDL